jgi:excinuclease ABC subunit A
VSGSGKSTLVNEILFEGAGAARFYRGAPSPAPTTRSTGMDRIDKVIDIDQSPIGRTPRSNPATYTGLFTPIRELFAELPSRRCAATRPAASAST